MTPEQIELARLRAELAKTKMKLDIVKKPQRTSRSIPREVRFCRPASEHVPVPMLCEQLEVSPSGYHQHRQRLAPRQDKPYERISNDASLTHIKAIQAQVQGDNEF